MHMSTSPVGVIMLGIAVLGFQGWLAACVTLPTRRFATLPNLPPRRVVRPGEEPGAHDARDHGRGGGAHCPAGPHPGGGARHAGQPGRAARAVSGGIGATNPTILGRPSREPRQTHRRGRKAAPRAGTTQSKHASLPPALLGSGSALVFLNGNILGVHRRPKAFVRAFREMRRRGKVGEFVSVYMQVCLGVRHVGVGGMWVWRWAVCKHTRAVHGSHCDATPCFSCTRFLQTKC